jgi:aryl-alcohol dehydrogenase-like predicted oxidoreductase
MKAPRQQAAGSENAGSLGGLLTIGNDIITNRLGFGAMRLCGPGVWGEPPDPAAAKRVLLRAVELGITLIDTADAYGPEVNERLIGDVLHPYPDRLIIATKAGLTRPRREAWNPNGRPEHLRSACEGSLRRLKLQRIDLYQLHAPDPVVPLEESVGTLADLRTEGKIRHIGLSNVDAEELRRARRIAPIVSVQNRYNISDRSSEDVLSECEKLEIAFLPWHPLAAGGSARGSRTVAKMAEQHSATPAQIALAWLLAHSPVMAPIPGTSSLKHLEENVAAAQLVLSEEDLRELS